MTDLTQDQLRAQAERLAVEVMGAELTDDVCVIGKSWANDFDKTIVFKRLSGELALGGKVKCDKWQPWENLSQAWMVKEGMLNLRHNKAHSPGWKFRSWMNHDGRLIIYDDAEQAARAIFDAAIQAMGWEE